MGFPCFILFAPNLPYAPQQAKGLDSIPGRPCHDCLRGGEGRLIEVTLRGTPPELVVFGLD